MYENKLGRKQGTEKQEHRTQGRKQETKSSCLIGFVAVGMRWQVHFSDHASTFIAFTPYERAFTLTTFCDFETMKIQHVYTETKGVTQRKTPRST